MRSMTGFGKSELVRDGRQIRVEVKSVNHRYLDVSTRMPHLLNSADQAVRNVLKEYVARGHIELTIGYVSDSPQSGKAVVDMARVMAYVDAASAIAEHTGLPNDLSVVRVLQMGDIVTFEPSNEEENVAREMALEALRAACEEMVAAREREGTALWADIAERVQRLRAIADILEERESDVVMRYKERLEARVNDLTGPDIVPDPQRIAQEIALFADRCNVTEEVIRIRSHLDRIEAAGLSRTPQGRHLDFLAQELHREFNTIGSKSQDEVLADNVIRAKAEVEKIREQVQNLE